MSETLEVGIYGKLPSHGDFLQRRVPPEFLTPWDEWLQAGIAASRTALAAQWTDTYLTSPVWRFALSAGACGRAPVAGLMAPSVDRVGRFFPLTLMWRLPPELPPLVYASIAGEALAPAEQLLVDSLTADALDFEHFDEGVTLLGPMIDATLRGAAGPFEGEDLDGVNAGQNVAWHLATGAAATLTCAFAALLQRTLDPEYKPLTLWWTDGSAMIEPCCLLVRGLPAADAFVSLLDGSWGSGEWRSVRTLGTPERPVTAPVVRAPAVAPALPAALRSSGLSDPGGRSSNQDALIERTPLGLWAVADGLGGLSEGDVASRMVCDVIASLAPNATLDGTVEDIRRSLDEVNARLYRAAQRPLDPVQSCSTVVALALREERAAVLWAGDSRAYRLRRGSLERLTADHNEEPVALDTTLVKTGEEPGTRPNAAVTRAVGGIETLDLDLRVEPVEAGDRFLLCSDGLTRALDDRVLSQLLTAERNPELCVRRLVFAANRVPADDNVTAIVIDA
ncbi:MAG TPA: type VI secretion system-associated protein TagF [Steroidobacteraceae bacterium]|jgi:type VI secretion system protein ImpM|nr:type VI secretion system-associated protein TagF [Steroidobacteraceae bacterium]